MSVERNKESEPAPASTATDSVPGDVPVLQQLLRATKNGGGMFVESYFIFAVVRAWCCSGAVTPEAVTVTDTAALVWRIRP